MSTTTTTAEETTTGMPSVAAASPRAGGRVRVAVIGPLPPPTHGHMVVTQRVLSSALLQQDFDIVHVDISDNSPLDGIGRLTGRNVWLGLRHAGRLWRTLSRGRADVAYVPLSQNLLGLTRDGVLLAICLWQRVRVVGHVHGGGFADFLESAPRWFSAALLALLRRCHVLVVMSNQHRRSVARVLPAAQMVVLPHGVPAADGPRRQPGDRLHALYVSSSLTESKGTFVALDAARILRDRGVEVDWTFVGPWRNPATKAAGLPVVDGVPGVRFTGELSQQALAHLYRDADLFVFPTGRIEGFGMVRIEALAAGLPVITTPSGGGAEIVGEAGFIVGFDSPVEVADRIRQLDLDRDLLREFGERARQRHESHFSEAAFERGLSDTWRLAMQFGSAARSANPAQA